MALGISLAAIMTLIISSEIIVAEIGEVTFEEAQKYIGFVSAYRQGSIAKKKSDEDKLLSLAAGLLTSLEISRRTGIPRKKIRYTHGSFGKPYIIGSELQFSISHTGGAVCAAFSDLGEIGVDIERKNRRISERLYSRVLNQSEKPLVKSGEDFLRIWVQKEAFLKRLGTGIAADLRGADTTVLRDTAAFDCGEYVLGVSGKGADSAAVQVIQLRELLREYDRICTAVN